MIRFEHTNTSKWFHKLAINKRIMKLNSAENSKFPHKSSIFIVQHKYINKNTRRYANRRSHMCNQETNERKKIICCPKHNVKPMLWTNLKSFAECGLKTDWFVWFSIYWYNLALIRRTGLAEPFTELILSRTQNGRNTEREIVTLK